MNKCGTFTGTDSTGSGVGEKYAVQVERSVQKAVQWDPVNTEKPNHQFSPFTAKVQNVQKHSLRESRQRDAVLSHGDHRPPPPFRNILHL